MTRRRYPLAPLARLRASRLDAAERTLAGATTARDAAEGARVEAERARDEHHDATARTRAAERVALERGDLCAGDLAREHDWARARDAEVQHLENHLAQARASEDRARASENHARASAARCAAEARVVREHAARWENGQLAMAERAAEEEATEAWGARQRPGRADRGLG